MSQGMEPAFFVVASERTRQTRPTRVAAQHLATERLVTGRVRDKRLAVIGNCRSANPAATAQQHKTLQQVVKDRVCRTKGEPVTAR